MVIFLLTFIYILIFEEFKIDMRFYLMLFIILMAAYRASKKLQTSVFNFLDFYHYLYFCIKSDIINIWNVEFYHLLV